MAVTTSAQLVLNDLAMESREGLPEQYWELIEEYRGVLVNQAFSILGCIEDAEDVAQETFCEAIRRPKRLAQARSVGAYLRTINRANALNRLRDRRRDSTKTKRKQEDGRARTFTSGGFSLLEMREWLAKAFETLPAKMRAVMVLRYWEQLPFEEIARRLRLPLSTVWRRHYEASMRLYGKLKGHLGAAGHPGAAASSPSPKDEADDRD